jgi:hypothetical protein
MILNYGELGKKALVHFITLPDGFTLFTLRVHGRLAGGGLGDHRIVVRGYPAGIDCCDFGQANAAVLGFARSGKPVLLMNRGALEVSDESVKVGCSGCISVTDTANGKLVATYPSPAWALHLTGRDETDFHLANSGDLFLQQGNSCVQIFRNAMFRVVPAVRCSGKPPQKLRLIIKSGACT